MRSYLSIEPIILQEGIGHLSPAGGLFQSHIQAIRENLIEQRMIVSIRCHLPTKHAQMSARISSAIVLDKLGCLEIGRHNDLKEIGQTV